MIYDYYKKIEARTSELGIIAEKAIEFREFDIEEGFIRGRILFIDGSVLEFLEYLSPNFVRRAIGKDGLGPVHGAGGSGW